MNRLEELNGGELPKNVLTDGFYPRFIHDQDSASGSPSELPCSFDSSCSNPRHTSGGFKADRNAISGRMTC